MKDINRVHGNYIKIDNLLSLKESTAVASTSKDKWANLRSANDQAYFVLIFAQFEDLVNTRFKKLVKKKQAVPLWYRRRSWDIIDMKRIPFMIRVALLTEIGNADYNMIYSYYKLRCTIAHGDIAGGIIVSILKNHLIEIARRLKI
ncbi:MAG: hypothetical protein WAX69_16925 [Victivallales bacterium]